MGNISLNDGYGLKVSFAKHFSGKNTNKFARRYS